MGEVDEKAGGNKKKETFQVNLPTSIKNERSSRGKFLLTRDAQKWNGTSIVVPIKKGLGKIQILSQNKEVDMDGIFNCIQISMT